MASTVLALNLLPSRASSRWARGPSIAIPFGDHRRFAKGPAQIRIAQLGPAQALELASAGHGAFDQPAIGQEIFDGGKAGDVADLVENGQAQIIADARRGL